MAAKIRCEVRQRILHALDGLIDVVARLLMDIDHDRPLAVQPRRLADVLDAGYGAAEVADPHRRAVAVGDDDGVESRSIENLIGRVERHRLLRAVERAFRNIDGGGDDRSADVFEGHPHGRSDHRVDLNADRRLLLAVIVDEPDPGDARNLRREVVLDHTRRPWRSGGPPR